MSRTDVWGGGTEGTRELPDGTEVPRADIKVRPGSSLGASAFPGSGRVILARGTGIRSVEVPLDLDRERNKREHWRANRGLDPQCSTTDG